MSNLILPWQIYGVEPAESNVLNGGKPGKTCSFHSYRFLVVTTTTEVRIFLHRNRSSSHYWKRGRIQTGYIGYGRNGEGS